MAVRAPLLTHGAVVSLRAEQAVHDDYGTRSLGAGLLGRIMTLESELHDLIGIAIAEECA